MARGRDVVHEAIRRWEDGGLVGAELAATLRHEVTSQTAREGRRWAQYILAVTAALLTIIAAVVFLGWAWPIMAAAGRTMVLAGAGAALVTLGIGMERRDRWTPVAYLLQTAGLGVLLLAYAYSGQAWLDASPGGIVVGALALATPLFVGALTLSSGRRNAVMPAVEIAFGYAFLFLFLRRATALDADTIIWILDGVMVLSLIALALHLRARAEAGDAEESGWAVNAFVASLFGGMVMVAVTAVGPLDAEHGAAWGLDAWLVLVVALTLWGIHRAPPGLRRGWYDRQLAICVLIAVGLALWTTLGTLDTPDAIGSAAAAAVGAVALRYALVHETRDVVIAGCLALIVAAWHLGATQAGALGAVLALGFSAGLLFWLSARWGRRAVAARS